MALVAQPMTQPAPIDVTIEDDSETCYVCGSEDFITECEACEQLICDVHTRTMGRPCLTYSEWCPVCFRKKQRGEI